MCIRDSGRVAIALVCARRVNVGGWHGRVLWRSSAQPYDSTWLGRFVVKAAAMFTHKRSELIQRAKRFKQCRAERKKNGRCIDTRCTPAVQHELVR